MIKIFGSGSKEGLIYKAEDVTTLRNRYRIVGRLIGSHPHLPRQNDSLGLPLLLNSYEVALLTEKGFADMVKTKPVSFIQRTQQKERFSEYIRESYEEQKVLAYESKCAEISDRSEQIVAGILKKSGRSEATEVEKKQIIDNIMSKIQPIPEDAMLVQTAIETRYPAEQEVIQFEFPITHEDQIKYTVFKHLWTQGYYITPGGKFGGDFLVYEGDPDVFHSKYIITCRDDSQITSHDVVGLARLASNVKKTSVICTVNSDTDEILFNAVKYQRDVE